MDQSLTFAIYHFLTIANGRGDTDDLSPPGLEEYVAESLRLKNQQIAAWV